ncbi:MAG: alpha/beta hydrolase fold protein [Myxococcales bacterium]|nr:alpha/beta hydrolase fold protein [Myxococcales bacterium]
MKKLRSADGTFIAFESAGKGPPVILVGGAFNDRRAKASGTPLAELLSSQFTVFSYDRRGRGDSTDTPPYAIEREVEDLAALIANAGGSAALYGMSSGGLLAAEAAVRVVGVTKLALYEPPVVLDASRRPPESLATELAELAATGRRSEAAELFLTRVVGVPPPVVAGMKRAPMWRGLEALAHTLSYDVQLTAGAPALIDRASSIRAPTLVMDGSASPPWMHEGTRALAAAVPAGHHRTLDGQTHDVDPAVLATALQQFLAA